MPLPPLSPWIIVVLSSILAVGLWKIHLRGVHGWRLLAVLTIPLSIDIVYLWIGSAGLSSDAARELVRPALVYSLSVGIYVTFSYYETITHHNRRHDDQ